MGKVRFCVHFTDLLADLIRQSKMCTHNLSPLSLILTKKLCSVKSNFQDDGLKVKFSDQEEQLEKTFL